MSKKEQEQKALTVSDKREKGRKRNDVRNQEGGE